MYYLKVYLRKLENYLYAPAGVGVYVTKLRSSNPLRGFGIGVALQNSLNLFIFTYLFGCSGSWLWHVNSLVAA